ncbi:P-loop containing nucleoside triphosphate hydrolase protein [Xylogone sp. PMI_703]|nr:P-loop containing nucleoside triphosphate hydrolase protein [Xylogone sp. PMI_703]
MPPGVCFDFKRGHCRRGLACRYSHDLNAPCPYYGTKRGCFRGEECSFSHDIESTTLVSPRLSKPTPTLSEPSTIETACQKWTNKIPRSTNLSRDFQQSELEDFFQMGMDLIDDSDADTQQYIITKLGSETGLIMVEALINLMNSRMKDTDADIDVFVDITVPFYRMLSHPDILSSLVLETSVDAVYKLLFGPDGIRALDIIVFTTKTLRILGLAYGISDNGSYGLAVYSSLVVLDRLIEVDQEAEIIKTMANWIKIRLSLIPQNAIPPIAQRILSRTKYRLDIKFSHSGALKSSVPGRNLASFELDLPGDLSNNGPRHDNDHRDISNIQILPTKMEILSQRPEYLPIIDSTTHHLPGLAGLLDRQFRLLREDVIGQLRETVREEYSKLQDTNEHTSKLQKDQEIRNFVYTGVYLVSMQVDKRTGLQVVVEFDQPLQILNKPTGKRAEWWRDRKLLQSDSLLCFVSAAGKLIFFSICNPSHVSSLSRDPKRVTVLLTPAGSGTGDVSEICKCIGIHIKSRQSLIEFPGVLLAGFQPTLQALQKMSRSLDLPFSEVIAPDSPNSGEKNIQPPIYTQQPGFKFNLGALSRSTFDRGQQSAVWGALTSGLTLIRGPPGTGKSYTGVSILKTLIHNRDSAGIGPIICVCYTNHALDQLLESLIEHDIEQVIRLGSRSKSERLGQFNLSEAVKTVVSTKVEKHAIWKHNVAIEEQLKEMDSILSGLNNLTSLENIWNHLRETNFAHFGELFEPAEDEDNYQEARSQNYASIVNWLEGGRQSLLSNRSISSLSKVHLSNMTSSERKSLFNHWLYQRNNDLTNALIGILNKFYDSKIALEKCYQELNIRCLQQAHIIGVTTSGLAKNIDMLQRVQSKVVLCEEAGEILEAHTLTAFLPGIEHIILIGDHMQLRPQINNYKLQHDNPRGKKYSLDVSLFERLVMPLEGNVPLPYFDLDMQRRMHPSIAELVRCTLYPKLRDHPSVTRYPEIDGMRHRLYWLDHQQQEDPQTARTISFSKTNSFEVELVEALVRHLVYQGTFYSGDIAILTPYLGQLQRIKKRLAGSFRVEIGDQDQQDLEANGVYDRENPKAQGTDLVRIATVDNFQGDEAKVVIISLVRSNKENNCGFLKTSNRINVLLSRAKHGMYIIGNSRTARVAPMWEQVIAVLKKSNSIGSSLALRCSRHTNTQIQVSNPDDFARLAPEGGCTQKCSWQLQCGHHCSHRCHSLSEHNVTRCLQRCTVVKDCGHRCSGYCGEPCEKQCQVVVSSVELPCGHTVKSLKCYQAQIPEKPLCKVKVNQVLNKCGHKLLVPCNLFPLEEGYPCPAVCGALLLCGHRCTGTCKDCKFITRGMLVGRSHILCSSCN